MVPLCLPDPATAQCSELKQGAGRDQEAFYGKQATIARTVSVLMNASDLDKPRAQLAALEERRAIVLKAQAEIERLIAAAPDYRAIADRRASTREWARQQDLAASRKALVNGVEYIAGFPCVPNALKQILCVVVEADGREVPNWFGSLTEIDQRIGELTRKRDRAQSALDAAVRQAETLLAEQVTR